MVEVIHSMSLVGQQREWSVLMKEGGETEKEVDADFSSALQ